MTSKAEQPSPRKAAQAERRHPSAVPETLSASEIESLRQDKREAIDRARKAFSSLRPKGAA